MIWSWLKFHNVDQILKSVGKILYIGINQMFVDLYVGLYSTFSFFSAMICKHSFKLSLQEDKDNWMKIVLSCLYQRFFSPELRQNSILIPKFRQNSILICGSHLPPCFTSCIPTFCPSLHCLQYICWPMQMPTTHAVLPTISRGLSFQTSRGNNVV